MAVEEDLQEKLMEQLRKGNKQVRSFDEIAQLLHMISSEQKARNMLRSCTDKVLMNMSDIHSLRDILDRLRSVARTNGLLFKLLLDKQSVVPETSCQISGDLFELEIVLDGRDNHFNGPAVLDVNITYSKQVKSCPELVEIIRNGKFLELSKHLKALIELYPMTLDRQTKLKVYMALQSLETDVNKMSQLYIDSRDNADSINVAMHGLVGLLASRVTGMCFQLHYFLTPYDLLNLKTGSLEKALDQLDDKRGLQAEIRIKSHSSSSNLPITPLISNNHPVSGSEKPRFLDVNQHNSVSLPACFVLKLKPKVLLVQQIASEIEKETGMPLFGKDAELQSYLSLIKKESSVQEVIFDAQKHIYNLNVNHLKAGFATEILFTHPGHLVSILSSLRKQSYLNCVFESCIRPKKSADKDIPVWHYDVSLEDNMSNLHITFQHPLSPNSTAFAEIALSGDGFLSCCLFTGRSDPILCTDQYALTILQKSFSLPMLMRAIILQTQHSPRKEPDRHRTSRQSIYQHRATSQINKKPPAPPPISQSQPKPASVTVPTSPAPSATKPMFSAFKPTTEVLDLNKKETQHPMLTQLLKPQGQAVKVQATAVQTKTHPMLMGLLKENDPNQKMAPQQSHVMHQRPLQQQTPPPPQYGTNNQPSMSYVHQMSQQQPQDQMPPPPSYYSPGSVKSSMQQQQQYQAQQQIPPNYFNPSPLGFEELTGASTLPQLTSPYNPQGNASHSTTPPLFSMIPSPLASPSSQPSPMSFAPSPRQPPMNTPQSLPMTSPRHSAMTPPMLSPAARRVSVGRRVSRPKSRSTDQSGFDTRNDGMDIGFATNFDMISESDPNQLPDMQDVFGAGLSPANSQQTLHQALPSPALSSARSQRHLSGERTFNFSFDSDLLDSDSQRRTSFGRRLSNQPFMTPSPVLSTQENQDTNFPIPSPVGSMEGFHPASFALSDNKPTLTDVQQNQNFGARPIDLDVEGATEEKNPPNSGLPPDETDIFIFDDSKTPQKISMPDSMSDPKMRPGLSSRSSSISSNSGMDESTLKGLLVTGPGGGNNSLNKAGKTDKASSIQPGKVKRKKGEGTVEDSELRGIVLNVQLNKGTPISSTTKTRPVPADLPGEKTPSNASNGAASAAASAPTKSESKKLDNLQQYPSHLRQYFLDQDELEKKKKEKKIASGSPLASINKNNNKSTLQSGLTGNSSAIRNQLASAKSVTSVSPGTSKSANLPHQKSGPASSQPKAGSRSVGRKTSIKDVSELLRAKAESAVVKPGQVQVGGTGEKRTTPGSVTTKATDRPGTNEQMGTGFKLKGAPSTKFTQYPKLVVNKSVGDERAVGVKALGPAKQGVRSKSPGSHPVKQAVGAGRAAVQTKRDKARPVTPIRDGKASNVTAILKNQPTVIISNTKTDKMSMKVSADSGGIQAKSTSGQNIDQAKRAPQNRPPSANKSPRSVTPPQARLLPQGGAAQSKSSMGKRSPSHSTESGDDPRFRSGQGKRPAPQEPPFLPPPTKKAAVSADQAADTKAAPRPNPRSPDDRLVIDDGTEDVTNAANQAVRTVTPPISQPPPLTNSGSAAASYVNVAASVTDFSASPAIPYDIDDDLMDVAVS